MPQYYYYYEDAIDEKGTASDFNKIEIQLFRIEKINKIQSPMMQTHKDF